MDRRERTEASEFNHTWYAETDYDIIRLVNKNEKRDQ